MERNFLKNDIISIEDFSKEDLNYIINHAEKIKKNPQYFSNAMTGKTMISLFFENSTRTATSFKMAMLQLGGNVMEFNSQTSSLKKGETLKDTLKMMDGYNPDIVVMRHPNDGSVKFASTILNAPIINAGDGQNQHPTQTMLDLFSIKDITGKIDGTKIAMVGDLKYGRTAHSLAIALSKYENCRIYFISPESLKIPKKFINILTQKNIEFSEHDLSELKNIIEKIDILYMTRIQRERFPIGREGEEEYEKISKIYCLKKEILNNVNPNFKIMHPLPKIFEIEEDIDETPYAYYFKQAANGLHIRKALLNIITQNGII